MWWGAHPGASRPTGVQAAAAPPQRATNLSPSAVLPRDRAGAAAPPCKAAAGVRVVRGRATGALVFVGGNPLAAGRRFIALPAADVVEQAAVGRVPQQSGAAQPGVELERGQRAGRTRAALQRTWAQAAGRSGMVAAARRRGECMNRIHHRYRSPGPAPRAPLPQPARQRTWFASCPAPAPPFQHHCKPTQQPPFCERR